MENKRHKRDSETFRSLAKYSDRVKSFNKHCSNLREYVRVMIEIDSNSSRTEKEIIEKRTATLYKEISAINKLIK